MPKTKTTQVDLDTFRVLRIFPWWVSGMRAMQTRTRSPGTNIPPQVPQPLIPREKTTCLSSQPKVRRTCNVALLTSHKCSMKNYSSRMTSSKWGLIQMQTLNSKVLFTLMHPSRMAKTSRWILIWWAGKASLRMTRFYRWGDKGNLTWIFRETTFC